MVAGLRVAVLTMEGANCEEDLVKAFELTGADADLLHINQVTPGRAPRGTQATLEDYDILAVPGGFSAGDYVRAGAIYAARLKSACGKALDHFHEARKPIVGVCNGFQVLVETGLLPRGTTSGERPDAVLATNESARYECRPTLVQPQDSVCKYLGHYPRGKSLMFPSAHGEGRLLGAPNFDERDLTKGKQVAFRYVSPTGGKPGYPWNPSGSPGDVAGVCDPTGTVLGLMPHPERALWGWQHPDWTRGRGPDTPGDGLALFQGIVEYAAKR